MSVYLYRLGWRTEARNRSPFGVAACNGMNLRKSITNPKSNLSRIVNYIRKNGESEKATIMWFEFGRIVSDIPWYKRENIPKNVVTRGWCTYCWGLAIEAKILVKTRRGRRVFYSLGENADKVVTV